MKNSAFAVLATTCMLASLMSTASAQNAKVDAPNPGGAAIAGAPQAAAGEPRASSPNYGRDSSLDDYFTNWLEDPEDAGWLKNRLEIGLRAAIPRADTTHRWNEDKHSGFLGTMEYLNKADDCYYNNFVISYKLLDWFAISATWDEISEVANTRSGDNHDDGEWYERGPSLTAVITVPRLFGYVSPYLEIGAHFPTGGFDAYPWWALGYPSPAYYAEIGSPRQSNGGYRRIIDAEEADSVTLVYGVGIKLYVTENLALDVAYRHIDCDIKAHYYLESNGRLLSDRGNYEIPLSYGQVCAGIRWAF